MSNSRVRSLTRLSIAGVFVLAASSCITPTEDVDSSESDLTIRLPPGSTELACPENPPMSWDPLWVGDTKSNAIIIHDSDVFWANYVAPYGSDANDAATIKAQIENPRGVTYAPIWETGERVAAYVQMYDLIAPIEPCRGRFYLARIRAIADALLAVRDDKRTTFPVHPLDRFRNQYMAAWGYSAPDRDWLWTTDVVTAGLFTYPMAAFAKRVALNPTAFSAEYQTDAIRFVTAVTETYISFRPSIWLSDTSPWAYSKLPSTYSTLTCSDPNAGQCSGYKANAGYPSSWNEDLALTRALAENAIAANSPLYRTSAEPNKYTILDYATIEAPRYIAKNVQFFVGNLSTKSFSDGAIGYVWNHEYHSPNQPQPQNTAHGSFELGSVGVIYEDKPQIDAMLYALNRPERVPLSATTLKRFATTFLRLTWGWSGSDTNLLSINVNGTGGRSLTANANAGCAGFAPLAQVDYWVWIRCRDATAKFPSWRSGNFAALLRYR